MNMCIIIGNLTADPETRSTKDGKQVVSFTLAVNRKKDGVDYFRVSAWNRLGEVCKTYLAMGRKCMVSGSIRAGGYTNSDGKAIGTLELMADEVEFLSPRGDAQAAQTPSAVPDGYVQVTNEELPF